MSADRILRLDSARESRHGGWFLTSNVTGHWLDLQDPGFYLLIPYCLVYSCTLNTGAIVSTGVKTGHLESHRINKIWSSFSYANDSLL